MPSKTSTPRFVKPKIAYDKELEAVVRAHGRAYKRKAMEIIRLEMDTEHFYFLSNVGFLPGVTSILDEAAPVGFGLRQFWQQNTAQDSREILETAGNFGSKMHDAFERLLLGAELNLLEDYQSQREKRTLMAFGRWFETIACSEFETEQTIASKKYYYAGTLDFVGTIRRRDAAAAMNLKGAALKAFIGDDPDLEERWLIDFKTSKSLHYNHQLQVAAYRQAYEEGFGTKIDRVGLLQVGSTHAAGFNMIETKRSIADFLNVYRTYLDLHDGEIPQPKDITAYPDRMQILRKVEENVLPGQTGIDDLLQRDIESGEVVVTQ